MKEEKGRRMFAWVLCILALLNIFLWHIVYSDERDELIVAFLDVGRGDAIYVRAPDGSDMLIDVGSGRQILRSLSQIMPFYDHTLDALLISYPDTGHIGGVPAVLERYHVGRVIEPGLPVQNAAYAETMKDLLQKHIVHIAAHKGMRILLGGEVQVDILSPDKSRAFLESTNAYIVAKLTYGDTSFLFTGGASKGVQENLKAKDLDTDVLKVARYGSQTGTSQDLIDLVSPQYAVISVDIDNKYGYPDKEILDALGQAHVPVYMTSKDGTIIFHSNKKRFFVDK